jgi:hypothetical protein
VPCLQYAFLIHFPLSLPLLCVFAACIPKSSLGPSPSPSLFLCVYLTGRSLTPRILRASHVTFISSFVYMFSVNTSICGRVCHTCVRVCVLVCLRVGAWVVCVCVEVDELCVVTTIDPGGHRERERES